MRLQLGRWAREPWPKCDPLRLGDAPMGFFRETDQQLAQLRRTDRRTFLKATGAVALAANAGTAVAQTAPASPRARPDAQTHPKNMTYATIQSGDGYGLGIRTERGILNVKAAEAALKTGAPVTVEQVIRQDGDLSALQKLVDMARPGGEAAQHVIAEGDAMFGPAIMSPPKILCIGLNYRAHVAEANQQIP